MPLVKEKRPCSRPARWLAGSYASGYTLWVTSMNMQVRVLFFGPLREQTGLTEELVALTPGATLDSLFQVYTRRFPALASFRATLVASRNLEFARWSDSVAPGDEVAFLPPVSGG